MFHKCISFRRRMRIKHINHKEYIRGHIQGVPTKFLADPVAHGKLNKGKVHCSCPLCAAKSTSWNGKTTNSLIGYKASDRRKFDTIQSKLEESFEIYLEDAS